jgi:peptidylprolyl isomerase
MHWKAAPYRAPVRDARAMLYFHTASVLYAPMRPSCLVSGLLAGLAAAASAASPPASVTPSAIVAQAPATAWHDIAPDDLLVMTVDGAKRIVIQLAPRFAPAHVANIRTLARAQWWDGTSINRVQDNYVVQWGDITEKKPLPAGMPADIKPDYVQPLGAFRADVTRLPYPDSYAPAAGFVAGWPVAMNKASIWLPHCYAMVGVGRNLSPDAGTGAELYTVIGHAPRQLDRNIAVVGRIVEGLSTLSSLPRGTGDLGFYTKDEHPVPILSIRLASDMPAADQPHFQVMDTASASFRAYVHARANRKDDFYDSPAAGVDLCNVPVPVRVRP